MEMLRYGTFIVHYPAMTYTDATSTSEWPDRIVVVQTDPTGTSDQTRLFRHRPKVSDTTARSPEETRSGPGENEDITPEAYEATISFSIGARG